MTEVARGRVFRERDVAVSSQPVRIGGRSLPASEPGAQPATGSDTAGEATVREVRDQQGRVIEIHVRCACGSTSVIACDYAA